VINTSRYIQGEPKVVYFSMAISKFNIEIAGFLGKLLLVHPILLFTVLDLQVSENINGLSVRMPGKLYRINNHIELLFMIAKRNVEFRRFASYNPSNLEIMPFIVIQQVSSRKNKLSFEKLV